MVFFNIKFGMEEIWIIDEEIIEFDIFVGIKLIVIFEILVKVCCEVLMDLLLVLSWEI